MLPVQMDKHILDNRAFENASPGESDTQGVLDGNGHSFGDNTLPELGRKLGDILANPGGHSIGAFAELVKRIQSEFELLRPLATLGDDPLTAKQVELTDDDLIALFESSTPAPTALGAQEIDYLAGSLERLINSPRVT